MKTLLHNGTIIDGTGAPAFQGSVGVIDGRIAEIGRCRREDYDSVIDATGRVIAPGFIDSHSHSDLKILEQPYVEPKLRQGVTTEIFGQDGISMAPLPIEYIEPWRKNLAGLEGVSDSIDWSYQTTAGYLDLLAKTGVGPNVCYLVPHGNIRMEAMGLDNRLPTAEELERMREITRRELEAGAVGVSSGLIYIPCAYSELTEIVEICKVAAEFDAPFVVHQRSEADDILSSMEEILQVGRLSGVRLHFSHFKVCGKKNWDKIDAVLSLLDTAREEGLKVSFDQYPYVAGSTMLGVILPPWAHAGGTDCLLERLQDPEQRRRMVQDIETGLPGWDNFVEFAGLDQIFVTSVNTPANTDLIGKNLIDIGRMRGKNPYDAVFDLLYEEENAVGMVDFYGIEEHIVRFLTRPEQNICTDGLLSGKPHPRAFGAFPRVLGKYVREEKALSLESAIHKMTGKTAEVFNLRDRGRIAEGYAADLVVFDPDTVIDRGTFIDPIQYPVGVEAVLVNGQLVVTEGKPQACLPGQVLKLGQGLPQK
jgi:N-acyl-D-amino-acid deacylase